jgi:hypothetical protein
MNKKVLGLLTGVVAGIVDVVPMLVQKLPLEADLSAFCAWVATGFIISRIDLSLPGWAKGMVVGYLVALPVIILVGLKDPLSAVPILVMTFILGSLSGFIINRVGVR